MDGLSPFLVGGPAFSGTTLLALLCNQPGMVCLDEPDFESPDQAHRGLPVLQERVPGAQLPAAPGRALVPDETFAFVCACADAVAPTSLGIKTCDYRFLEFAEHFRAAGLPVVMIVRDIRDVLSRPLPEWTTEQLVNAAYRDVWETRALATLWIRYETLVADPVATMGRVGGALGYEGVMATTWDPAEVPGTMVKLDRHDLLRRGRVSASRVGVGARAPGSWSTTTWETARMMGYGD